MSDSDFVEEAAPSEELSQSELAADVSAEDVVVRERPKSIYSGYEMQERRIQQRSATRDYELVVDPRRFNNQRDEQVLALGDSVVNLIERAAAKQQGDISVARVVENGQPDIFEYVELDTPDSLVRGYKGLTIRLKRQPAPISKLSLQVRFRSLDPELTKRFFLATTARARVVRHRQSFKPTVTMYSVLVSVPCKFGKRFAKWKAIEALCPGICQVLGLAKMNTPVIRYPPKYIWRSSNFHGLMIDDQLITTTLSLSYAAHHDAVSGSEAFQGTLKFRLRKNKNPFEDNNSVHLDRLRKMYFFFYDHAVQSEWSYVGAPLKRPKVPRISREYQIAFEPDQWVERDGPDGSVKAFHKWIQDVGDAVDGFDVVDLEKLPPPRIVEHFALDSPVYHLKSRHYRDQLVVKMERQPATKKVQLTVKYKNWDTDLVESFPVRVAQGYSYTSKLEQDYHPTYARIALSLAVDLPFDQKFTAWGEIGKIFPGLLAFGGLDESWPVIVRFYKAKWEQNRQLLRISGANAIGKISLEYPTIKDALAGTNLFHGQWSYRIREPASDQERGKVWSQRLAQAYQIYFSHVVSSPWSFMGTNTNKPNQGLSPLLAETDIPCLSTCGLLVLRLRKTAPLYDVLVLKREGKKYESDFPKGKLIGQADELQEALRQTEEETGLKSDDLHIAPHLRFVGDRYVLQEGAVVLKKRFVLFLAVKKETKSKVHLSSQHVGFDWMPWDGVSPLNVGRVLLNQCIAQLAPHLGEFVQSLGLKTIDDSTE